MQGGNEVDYPGVISTSCQRSRCAVIGRPAGRRGEDQKIRLFFNNAINFTYCLEYHLKPSRIQAEFTGGGLIRSKGGWSHVVSARRSGLEEEFDERILGSGDFVSAVWMNWD